MDAKIKFYHPQPELFFQQLKHKVEEFFKSQKISMKGNAWMYLKSIFFLGGQVSLYIAMLFGHLSPLLFILVYSLFGIMTGLMNFNIVHDALHGAYSSYPSVNRLLGYLYDLNGTSSYVWKITHNIMHHTYTNIPGYDGDIDKATLLRLNPKDTLYPFHRYQHIYAFFLYTLASANWILYGDYVFFIQCMKEKKVEWEDVFLFFSFKALNLFLLVLFPFLYLPYPFWVVPLGYLCGQMSAGFFVSLIFQLAHVVDNVSYVEPDETGIIHSHWAAHELKTSANFATDNSFLTQLLGGLNHQVEHHLFPAICHIHYPKIRKFVQETAKEFHLPYHENPTFYDALKSHHQRLKRLGLANE